MDAEVPGEVDRLASVTAGDAVHPSSQLHASEPIRRIVAGALGRSAPGLLFIACGGQWSLRKVGMAVATGRVRCEAHVSSGKKDRKPKKQEHKGKRFRPAESRSPDRARPDYRVIDKYLAALTHLDAGRDKSAAKLLCTVIRRSPTFDEAIGLLYSLCLEHGWLDLLTSGLRDAYRGGNRDPDVLGQLITLSLELKKGEDATAFLDEFQARFPRRRKIGPWRIADLRKDAEFLSERARQGPVPSSQTSLWPADTRKAPLLQSPSASEPQARSTAKKQVRPVAAPPEHVSSPHRKSPRAAGPRAAAAAAERASRVPPAKASRAAPAKAPQAVRAKAPPSIPASTGTPAEIILPRPTLGPLRVTITLEEDTLAERLTRGSWNDRRHHELCLAAHRLSMVNSIDELLCMLTLHGVEELWYQVETVRKVLRRFRGRALLCDEVGLGKTIEAGMIIKEYMLRGLIRSVLVLVPPSLVAQWREEMLVKFGLHFATPNDPLLKRDPDTFWRESPLIIASLALAKTQRNSLRLAVRQFDLIVVDEAHHLRNRNTKAWKLVNSVKSRFLLLLTATPLHNNLEELHNLITLLKPGQLKTRAAFIREFVSKEDPTVPLNQGKLRELLGEVMIRNTRALAGLGLPPRHASTLAVDPSPPERELYDRLSNLVRTGYRRADGNGGLNRLTLRLLQTEAGSSPRALLKTLGKIKETCDPDSPLAAELRALAEIAGPLESHTKVDALALHLESSREKTIVFTSFRETLSFTADDLRRRGIEVILFHGGMTAGQKEAAIDAFRNGGRTLLTTEVGGEGRNLQFCHRMVNFDLPWNPMRIEQRIGRIHRIGQQHETEILNLCARGSVEDHLLEILDKKINLFELVIGEVDLILGQLEGKREFSERVLEAWASAETREEAEENFARLSGELGQAKAKYERIKSLDDSLFGEDYEV